MLGIERQNIIIENLQNQGVASLNQLATTLGVSEMTVRRDLNYLEQQGLVQRTRGGALLISKSSPDSHSTKSVATSGIQTLLSDPPFVERQEVAQVSKAQIGKLAASLLKPNEKIILDSGSTVAAICPFIPKQTNLTVITYSLPVLTLLIERADVNLVSTGGTARAVTHSLTGSLTQHLLEGVRVDKAFISATSVSLEEGFSNSDLENLSLQQIILKVARETYLLVDSTKFNRAAFWLVAPLSSVTAIITDSGVSKQIVERFEQSGLRLIVAPSGE